MTAVSALCVLFRRSPLKIYGYTRRKYSHRARSVEKFVMGPKVTRHQGNLKTLWSYAERRQALKPACAVRCQLQVRVAH